MNWIGLVVLSVVGSGMASTVSYCTGGTEFCLHVTGGTGAAVYTVQSSAGGWTSVGVATSQMSGKVFVGWANSTGGVTVSERTASGHTLPTLAASQSFALAAVPPAVAAAALPTGGITFAFTITDDTLATRALASPDFIYAFSGAAPADADSPASSFVQHDQSAAFTLDASGVYSSASASATATPSPAPASAVSAASYCYDSAGSFCVASASDSTAGTATFTVQSSSDGWVGVGIGSSMGSASAMFVGWYNSSGEPVISQRSAANHVQPSVSSSQVFTQVSTPSSVSLLSTSKLSFSFQIPISLISTTAATSFIFGISNSAPSSPDSASSNFNQHDTSGVFSLDLSKAGASIGTAESTSVPTLVVLHGLFMFLAWFVFPSAAIFIARFLKHRLGHLWYQLHVGLMIGGTGLSIILGLAFVEVYVVQKFGLPSFHSKLGVAIALGVYPLQVLLGYISNAKFSEDRKAIPWWDQLHWWIGRLVFLAAIVNIFLGLKLAGVGQALLIAFPVVIVLVFFVFVIAEWKMGAAHHVSGVTGKFVTNVELTEH
ncbi:hypothetical protein HK100_008327 [Physocladia obscura]|uniref:Cytochrome b561 domain-containing protein n=1 Tax=Physocladia obscura TaxID=109957 RepID=A0AAD5T6Y8_9FUNG|nr:hypothetical protein HK100_008327 [Physocladia obscura]